VRVYLCERDIRRLQVASSVEKRANLHTHCTQAAATKLCPCCNT